MYIYTHKVRMDPMGGWGQSTGLRIEVLGRYQSKEKAQEAKQKRDSDPNFTHCDVGSSWIEEERVV